MRTLYIYPIADELAYIQAKDDLMYTLNDMGELIDTLDHLSNLQYAVQRYGSTETLVYLYGDNGLHLSCEGLGEGIKKVFTAMLKFLINLKDRFLAWLKSVFSRKKKAKQDVQEANAIAKNITTQTPPENVQTTPIEKVPPETIIKKQPKVYVEKNPVIELTEDEQMEFAEKCGRLETYVDTYLTIQDEIERMSGFGMGIDEAAKLDKQIKIFSENIAEYGYSKGIQVEHFKSKLTCDEITKRINNISNNILDPNAKLGDHDDAETNKRIGDITNYIKNTQDKLSNSNDEFWNYAMVTRQQLQERCNIAKIAVRALQFTVKVKATIVDMATAIIAMLKRLIKKACADANAKVAV